MGQLVGQISYLLRPWNILERRKCIWKRKRKRKRRGGV